MQREKASLVVATHILYDNLVVNGKNVKLTSWGGSPNRNKWETLGTGDSGGVLHRVGTREMEVTFGGEIYERRQCEKVYICLYLLFVSSLFSLSLFPSLRYAGSDQKNWRHVIKCNRDNLDAADLTLRRVVARLCFAIFCLFLVRDLISLKFYWLMIKWKSPKH